VASIEQVLDVFSSKSIKVCVVSFGSIKGAEGWLKATNCKLDLFLDQNRIFYSRVGLSRSVSKVWQMSTIHYYGSMKAQGRTLPTAIQGEEDDPLQMGGDFTFRSADKTLAMSHPSKTPKDRPSVEEILNIQN